MGCENGKLSSDESYVLARLGSPFRGIVEQGNHERDELERSLIDNESFEVECEFVSLLLCVHPHLPFFSRAYSLTGRGE